MSVKPARKRPWLGAGLLLVAGAAALPAADPPLTVLPPLIGKAPNSSPVPAPCTSPEGEVLPIDLPAALQLADATNPTIGLARERVQAALFRQQQAQVAWLPNLQGAVSYQRHDGLIQNAAGLVFPVSRWSFFTGGGAV